MENIITYPELVKHMMDIYLLLLTDVPGSCCLVLEFCQLLQSGTEVVRRFVCLFVEEQINPQHLSEQLGQVLCRSGTEGGAAWAEHSMGNCSGRGVSTATDPTVLLRLVPHWLWGSFL